MQTQMKSAESDRKKVWDLVKDIQFAMMVTQDADGSMHGRPMSAMQKEFEGTLWFMTRDQTLKVEALEANPKVMLSYADVDKHHYVSLTGTARIVHDKAKVKDLWSEAARVWFPNGPDDPQIALIGVEVTDAEYWDSASSTMVYAYGYVKARLTGEPPSERALGENRKVNF
jgi:general stress protein 26